MAQIILPIRFAVIAIKERIDIVHINTALTNSAIVRDFCLTLVSLFLGKRILVHIHGGVYIEKEMPGALLNWIAGEMLHSADKVLVLSEKERISIENRWPGVRPLVAANAVELNEVDLRKKFRSPCQLVFFGRIDRDKGLNEIISACELLEARGLDFEFKCYGTGPDIESFAGSMNEVLGRKFEYKGIVFGQEKIRALNSADIFLLPSYYEGMPVSLLEAMAAGCVCVVSEVGSVGTVIDHGNNGFLIEPGNTNEIARMLETVIDGTADCRRIGREARRTIESQFGINGFSDRLDRLYDGIVCPESEKGAGYRH
ncbi:MAG: glycosyltransferase family 4 protein [Pyrinomonadaceae bacterium]|nr:glycosyltransferase family 4 protein [Pyrinomonadaceae bacterium]